MDETDLNGYEWSTVEPENSLTQTKIVSVKNNISTDLKLLNIILKNHYASKFIERNVPQLYAFRNKIVYEGEFVTTEIKTDGYPHRINNVTDAYVMLCNIVQQNDAYRNNYSHLKKIEIILDVCFFFQIRTFLYIRFDFFPFFSHSSQAYTFTVLISSSVKFTQA